MDGAVMRDRMYSLLVGPLRNCVSARTRLWLLLAVNADDEGRWFGTSLHIAQQIGCSVGTLRRILSGEPGIDASSMLSNDPTLPVAVVTSHLRVISPTWS